MLQPAPRYKWPAIAGHGGPQNAGLLPAARASNMCQRQQRGARARRSRGARARRSRAARGACVLGRHATRRVDRLRLAETQRRPHHRPKYRHTGKNAIKVVFPFYDDQMYAVLGHKGRISLYDDQMYATLGHKGRISLYDDIRMRASFIHLFDNSPLIVSTYGRGPLIMYALPSPFTIDNPK